MDDAGPPYRWGCRRRPAWSSTRLSTGRLQAVRRFPHVVHSVSTGSVCAWPARGPSVALAPPASPDRRKLSDPLGRSFVRANAAVMRVGRERLDDAGRRRRGRARVARPGEFDRTPPQAVEAEQSVLGAMMLSKDAIADVVEVHPARRLLPAGPPAGLRRRPRPLRPRRAGRRRHRLGRADPRRAARPGRRRAVPAHADLDGADGGQRRLLRRRSSPTGPPCAGWSPPAPASCRWATTPPRAATTWSAPSTTSSTARRPRSTTSPSGARSEDYVHIETLLQGTLDEIEKISATGGIGTGIPTGFQQLDEITNGLHPGQMITVAGRPGRGKSTLALDFARSAAVKHQQADGHLLPGDGQARDHDAAVLGRGRAWRCRTCARGT